MTEGEREMNGDLEDWAKKCMGKHSVPFFIFLGIFFSESV